MVTNELTALIHDILCDGPPFLAGLGKTSNSLEDLLKAIKRWTTLLNGEKTEAIACIEPCLRQSVLTSLLPSKVFDPSYRGSIDIAIIEHLRGLGLDTALPQKQIILIRDICIHINQLRGMNSRQARNNTYTLSRLRGTRPDLYREIMRRQNQRCMWCGCLFNSVPSSSAGVPSLEHIIPKHLGNDPADGSNWGIACKSCNSGKTDVLVWAAERIAHGYFSREDFALLPKIGLGHRHIVLARSKKCDFCHKSPNLIELFVYKRISTGLPVPANCGLSCEPCLVSLSLTALIPNWCSEEAGRAVP